MADEGYFRDQPRFERKDPLTWWSYVFLAAAGVAFLWLMLLLWLMATDRLASDTEALGLTQGTWVTITVVVLVAAIIGLFFVIVARIGGSQAGSYLSADVDDDAAVAGSDGATPPEETIPKASETERLIASTEPRHALDAARIDDPFGADGRMLMSYTVPEAQPRGVYGDTYVMVDRDQVLNVKTLLAKTLREG